jgi:hypothetical protein
MLKTPVIFKGKQYSASFFDDDTIDVVCQQISKVIDVHPARLLILVGLELNRNYYNQDERNWETLFQRLSMNGYPLEKEPFLSYCSEYRSDKPVVAYKKYTKDEWMSKPVSLQPLYDPGGEFIEYRIFGVESLNSYCLPFEFDSATSNRIPGAQYPIPDEGKIFISLYKPKFVRQFMVIEFEDGQEGPYFPLLRSVTPQRLSDDQITNLETSSKHLKDLLTIDPPAPSSINILRTSWRTDLVDTDFGAVRTRFEQIFYGMTLSKNVPCISFYTGKDEVSRHKFYKESATSRDPYLNILVWNAWWTKSKPAGDRLPSLVLYRGDERGVFDRITIKSEYIVFAVYRDTTNKDSTEKLKASLLKWFQSFDAILPFIKPNDLLDCRIELQEMRFQANYEKDLDQFDNLRLGCLAGIFEENKSNPNKFRFLRADNARDGINPRDLRIINLIKNDPFLKAEEVKEELGISLEEATRVLASINQKLEENPNLINRQFRDFPELEIHKNNIEINSVDSVDRFLKYANLLRYILHDPKDVDNICPKKLETSDIVVSTVQMSGTDEFSDLFGYLEEEIPQTVEIPEIQKTDKNAKTYGYFIERLEKFDPETFGPASKFPKVCEKKYQPISFTDNEINEIVNDVTKGSEFDPREYPENRRMKWEDPNGLLLCPDYWCMYDKIPLHADQLEDVKGEKVCPVCYGKIQDIKAGHTDPREYPVIQRSERDKYIKNKDDKSPLNGKNLPCCLKTPAKEKKIAKDDTSEYYILSEFKEVDSLRFAYLPESLISSLFLNETYGIPKKSDNRIPTGVSSFFRVGMTNPAEDLPKLLNLSTRVLSPRHHVKYILRCSFTALWTEFSDKYLDEIEAQLTMKPFSECDISRKHMAQIISAIDEAFTEKRLTPIQSLEYTAIVLKTDFFPIDLASQTMSCAFSTRMVPTGSRAVIILQSGDRTDCISYVTRQQRKFQFRSNIFEEPFKTDTFNELRLRRKKACQTGIPTLTSALSVMEQLKETGFSVVLDPFGRAQALYTPGKIILPFQNTPIPAIKNEKVSGFHELKDLPTYEGMKLFLEKVSPIANGYDWKEDMYDGKGNIVEIMTSSGLRIPVKPTTGEGEISEVTQTIIEKSETKLALGKENAKDIQTYKSISYAAEIYEFLIFQLTKDLETDSELKEVLSELSPKRADLEPLLEEWFDDITHFVSLHSPIEFLSKIRKPCGQFKDQNVCNSAHMCAWNPKAEPGKQCRIQVRDTVTKQKLFGKLLGTLLENSKIRAMVLDGRTTPFFSTILYLELPTEIIYTDLDIREVMNAKQV